MGGFVCQKGSLLNVILCVPQQQSWPLGVPEVSVGQPVALESSQFYPVLPVPRNGKGNRISSAQKKQD